MEQPALDGTSTLNALRRLEGTGPELPYVLVVDDQPAVRNLARLMNGDITADEALRALVISALPMVDT